MNKGQLIDFVVNETGESKASVSKTLEATLKAISRALSQGDTLSLVGFGTFKVTERSEREGRNPSTGAVIRIPASKVVKFSAGKNLKEAVNK